MVKTDYFSNFASMVITHVDDFEVFDNYMFATKLNTVSASIYWLLLFLFWWHRYSIELQFLHVTSV